jgi:Uma2 family endonuclease
MNSLTAAVPAFPVHRFTVEQYQRMIDANILNEGDNVELIEGRIVPKMTRKPPHDVAIELADDAFRPLVPAGWRLRIQCALTLDDGQPEPDLAVVRGDPRSRSGHHPGSGEIDVAADVSDSTLLLDRTGKLRMYARAGVPVYWIVNLVDRQIEVYTDPATPPGGEPRYQTRTDFAAGQQAPLFVARNAVGMIPVDAILP